MEYRLVELVEIIHRTENADKAFDEELESLAKKHGIEILYKDEYYHTKKTGTVPLRPTSAEDVQARSEP